MKNLKIGARLGLGFVCVVAIMVGMTIFSINRLALMDSIAVTLAKDRVPKVLMAHKIKDNINVIARGIRNMVMLKSGAEYKREADRIVEMRRQNAEILKEMEGRMETDEGKTFIKSLSEKRVVYNAAIDRVQNVIAEERYEDALKMLLVDVRPVQTAYFNEIDALEKYVVGAMEAGNKEAEKTYAVARWLLMLLLGVAVGVGVFVAIYVTRSITRPLNEAVGIAETVAKGDLTSKIEPKSTDETGMLLHALKTMNENLAHVCSQVRSGTATIALASTQIAAGNQDLSSRTEQQASSLEETASSMEELTSTVRQNGDNAVQANRLAISASDVAVKGGAVVTEVVQTMGSINESSRKIVDIISVIDGIAFQTNILALNAAVEAARAGEQGRGFAVVASEVRTLAQRSASAAREIKVLIDDSVEKVATGSRLVDQAGATMDEIVASIRRVTDIMAEITAATHEQVDGIEQINRAVVDMDSVTQQNAALVEQAAAAAESLQNQAKTLVDVVSRFHTGDGMMAAPALPMPVSPKLSASPALASKSVAEKARAEPLRGQPNMAVAMAGGGGEVWEEF